MASWLLSESPEKLSAFAASASSNIAVTLASAATGQAPSASTLSASPPTSSSITVSWTEAVAPSNAPVQGYKVYRQQQGLAATLAATVSATARTHTHSELLSGTAYSLWVVAFNAFGESTRSNTLTVTTTGGQVPTAPSLSYSSLTSTSVTLSWTAATAPSGDPVQGYRIYQGTSTTPVQQVGASVLSVSRVVSANTSYRFTVRAYNLAGNGPVSNTVEFTAPASGDTGTPPPPSTGDVVLYAAGDVAHATYLADAKRTGDTIRARTDKQLVLAIGDLAYSMGSINNFTQYYEPTWGSFKSITYPVPGNHEYKTAGLGGYKQYWGSRATPNGQTYYSFIRGSWLFLAMDSSDAQGAGGAGSGIEEAQVSWAAQQIEANRGKYTGILAYWHHPRFTSGNDGNNLDTASMVNMLRSKNADIVVCGHDHNYERFEKLNAAGTAIDPGGIRHFVVGTGGGGPRGKSTTKFGSVKFWGSGKDYTAGRRNGIVRFVLRPTNYSWEWIDCSSPKGPETDSGTTAVNPK